MRWPIVNSLTIPMKAFLATSVGSFSAIIVADRYSRAYEHIRRPESIVQKTSSQLILEQAKLEQTQAERAKDWLRANRYPIVFGSWLASMGLAFGLVHRNPYLTGAQKIVQARVYAQGLTVGVLVASFGLEALDKKDGKSRWETVMVRDPDDPSKLVPKRVHLEMYPGQDKWRDMITAEENRLKAEEDRLKAESKAIEGEAA